MVGENANGAMRRQEVSPSEPLHPFLTKHERQSRPCPSSRSSEDHLPGLMQMDPLASNDSSVSQAHSSQVTVPIQQTAGSSRRLAVNANDIHAAVQKNNAGDRDGPSTSGKQAAS